MEKVFYHGGNQKRADEIDFKPETWKKQRSSLYNDKNISSLMDVTIINIYKSAEGRNRQG